MTATHTGLISVSSSPFCVSQRIVANHLTHTTNTHSHTRGRLFVLQPPPVCTVVVDTRLNDGERRRCRCHHCRCVRTIQACRRSPLAVSPPSHHPNHLRHHKTQSAASRQPRGTDETKLHCVSPNEVTGASVSRSVCVCVCH